MWRLYLLRSWVYADPQTAAVEFDRGRPHVPVAEVISGVVEPPGPDEVRALVDEVLGGVVVGDFADTLFRASAFARVAAAGRVHRDPEVTVSASSYASDVSAVAAAHPRRPARARSPPGAHRRAGLSRRLHANVTTGL